jgi:hypothetical protein
MGDVDIKKYKKYEAGILKVISENPIYHFDDIWGCNDLPCSRTTAFLYKLNESDAIKSALNARRRKKVMFLKDKWINSENPTLQLAGFRLICESDEHRALNQQYTDHTTDSKPISIIFERNGRTENTNGDDI